MENPMACPKCGSTELKLVPAGVSKKSGKPYDAFYACKKWECGGTIKIPSEGSNASPRASYRPTNDAMATRKEFQNTMDYKAENIAKAQAHKDASMTNLAICRDAVQLTIAEMANGAWTDEMIRAKIKEWKEWLRLNVYETPF